MSHTLIPSEQYASRAGNAPHDGYCLGTVCPDCGCCIHCADDDHCDGCRDFDCGCSL